MRQGIFILERSPYSRFAQVQSRAVQNKDLLLPARGESCLALAHDASRLWSLGQEDNENYFSIARHDIVYDEGWSAIFASW
jgi:hypothetical protein